MSDQTSPLAKEQAKLEAQAQRDAFVAEQKALGRVRVGGWIPKDLSGDAQTVLDAIAAGQAEYLPASIAERQARLLALEPAGAELERSKQELRQLWQEVAQTRQDAAATQDEATRLGDALAAESRKRELAETHLADALAELEAARQAAHQLSQSGLRASLARLLLK